MSAFFVVAYIAISVPAIGAGLAVTQVGIVTTVIWVNLGVAFLSAAACAFSFNELRGTRHAPAPAH